MTIVIQQKMNASLWEKMFLGGTVSVTALFVGFNFFKKPQVKKEDAFKIRQELLLKKNVKMLFSTMSFFYLFGFKSKEPQSFFTMQSILSLQQPQIVSVPISKDEYQDKYEKALNHPRFRDAMDRFRHSVKNKKADDILDVKDFNLKNLQLLYIIDYCISLKKCKVVYARKEPQSYINMDKAANKLKTGEDPVSKRAKIQDYTDILIQEMKPQLKFSLSPQSPFKMIVGIIEPELVEGVARRWKQKFKQNYSHIVMQDEQVLAKQEQQQSKTSQFQQKFNPKQ